MARIFARGEAMMNARIRKGLDGAGLAEKIGVTRQFIYALENGRSGTSPGTAKAIVDVVGGTFDDLFTIQEEAEDKGE